MGNSCRTDSWSHKIWSGIKIWFYFILFLSSSTGQQTSHITCNIKIKIWAGANCRTFWRGESFDHGGWSVPKFILWCRVYISGCSFCSDPPHLYYAHVFNEELGTRFSLMHSTMLYQNSFSKTSLFLFSYDDLHRIKYGAEHVHYCSYLKEGWDKKCTKEKEMWINAQHCSSNISITPWG